MSHTLDRLKHFSVLKSGECPYDGMAVGNPKAPIGVKPIVVPGVTIECEVAILETIGRLTAVEDRFPEYIGALKGTGGFFGWWARPLRGDRPLIPSNMG